MPVSSHLITDIAGITITIASNLQIKRFQRSIFLLDWPNEDHLR